MMKQIGRGDDGNSLRPTTYRKLQTVVSAVLRSAKCGVTCDCQGVGLVQSPEHVVLLRKDTINMKSITSFPRERLDTLATIYAREAHEDLFSSRRGMWHFTDYEGLLYYNNNPWAADPLLRKDETERIVVRLRALGIKVVAGGEYGERIEGTEELYTITLLLDCKPTRWNEVAEIIGDEAYASLSRVHELSTGTHLQE